jgi:hypothetical protein
VQFFKTIATANAATLKQRIEELSMVEETTETYEEGGHFLPLSVYERRG